MPKSIVARYIRVRVLYAKLFTIINARRPSRPCHYDSKIYGE